MSQLSHWSLTRLPYGPPRRAGEFFAGSPQREALARLEYLIEFGDRPHFCWDLRQSVEQFS